jgi:hypothetical protein
MIFQKTRTRNLADVSALNMWGCELEDVSIIAQMPNVETLSLPMNKISTLAPFSYCKNLHSLLLRDNQISRIEEINSLQNLPHLITLSLIDNPITEVPNYRAIVIGKLPQLRTLDEISIPLTTPSEKVSRKAHSKGKPRDANMLAAVISLIPELSRDSLRIVLEAIEKRCH